MYFGGRSIILTPRRCAALPELARPLLCAGTQLQTAPQSCPPQRQKPRWGAGGGCSDLTGDMAMRWVARLSYSLVLVCIVVWLLFLTQRQAACVCYT